MASSNPDLMKEMRDFEALFKRMYARKPTKRDRLMYTWGRLAGISWMVRWCKTNNIQLKTVPLPKGMVQ